MENNFFRRIPTDLDLNGPVLAYTTQPSDTSANKDATATFTVAAEATFPGDTGAEDGGAITFQWFEDNGTALSNSGQFSGVTTSTLTISSLRTPQDDGRKFYCEISYTVNDEYGTVQSGTGVGINAPLKSNEVTLSVNPELELVTQPTSRTVGKNIPATFNVGANLSGVTYLSEGAITYQWYVGLGNATPTLVTDGTVTTTNITTESVTSVDEDIVTEVDTFTESESFGVGTHLVDIPSTAFDVSFTFGGASGAAGGEDHGAITAAGGHGRAGTFTIPNAKAGQPLEFKLGRIGNQGGKGGQSTGGAGGTGGAGSGGRGGGAGQFGWSGGGGGGGSSASVTRGDGVVLAVAAGGAGAGGASLNVSAENPAPYATDWQSVDFAITAVDGGNGQTKNGDGGGGGGGGSGAVGGAGGNSGQDLQVGGGSGAPGTSYYRGSEMTLEPQGTRLVYDAAADNFVEVVQPANSLHSGGNGYASIDWKYTVTTLYPTTETRQEEVILTTVQNTIISGQGTDTLTITSDEATFNAVRKVYCVVSQVSASNSPLTSDTVTSVVVDESKPNTIIIETISADDEDGDVSGKSTIDLSNGDQEFESGSADLENGEGGYLHRLHAPNKDIVVEMDLFGGRGSDNGVVAGGEGGYSRIRFTMERNVEYIIAGLTDSVNTPYIYKKAVLIANVGKGGDAGQRGGGGFGGGVSNSGAKASGRDGGEGGNVATTRSTNGIFGSLTTLTAVAPDTKAITPNGGVTATCTRGVYWRDQGVSACSDVDAGPLPDVVYQTPVGGFPKFRSSDGTEIENTTWLNSGYKTGYNIIQTAGKKQTSTSGNGGNGSVGGQGGSNGFGGGGGAGYVDSSVTVVDTQLGGSELINAKVILRAVPDDELIPGVNTGEVRIVEFTQSRSTTENIEIVLSLVPETGEGPATITFGSPTGFVGGLVSPISASIQEGAIYTVSSATNADERSLSGAIAATSGGGFDTLTLTDTDDSPGTLTITAQNGRWTSTDRYEFFPRT